MPNHVRAWRREAYHSAGGYASEVHVADDYELLLRTFLVTRFVHIKRFGYIQYLGDSQENTHRRRNREIQRAVHLFAARYEEQIRERFDELEIDDFIRVEGGLD
jgi:O-antigen biosynthesis protein